MWSSSLCAAFRQPVPLTPKSRIVGDSPTRGWGGRLGTLLAASRRQPWGHTLQPCLSSPCSGHSSHQLWGQGAGDRVLGWAAGNRVSPPTPASHRDFHLGSQHQPWRRLGAEREQVWRELNNKLALSGGFHLFCFKFFSVSACRARQRPQPAARGEGACTAPSGCCRFDTKTRSP